MAVNLFLKNIFLANFPENSACDPKYLIED